MRKKRIASITTAVGVGAALTLTAAVGITPSALADNSGRRICVYGYSNQNTDTAHVTHWAVADYKAKDNRTGGPKHICPVASSGPFLTAINWDNHIPFTWDDNENMEKIPCEQFLSEHLKGVVPDDFPEKRADYFCDNTEDDTLYDFTVTTTRTNGQESVSVVDTNTHVKLDL